jgi:hypothetical protein
MRTRSFLGLLVSALCFVPVVEAKTSFWETRNAYLGQTPPSDSPKVFAPGLLADKGMFLMGRVAFSSDGKEFYYAQNDSWNSGDHASMKVIRYTDHHWDKPGVLDQHFLSPTLSPDGKTLYMRRVDKKGSMNNVWQSQREADGWGAPKPFLEKGYGVYDFMPTANGNAYVGSEPSPEDVKNGITYSYSVLTNSNGVTAVKSLGRPVNEPGFNGDLYIAPDESYLIVSANETKTYESELYISFRKADSTWTKPVNLSAKINHGLAHRWGQYVSPDGKYLFFTQGTSEKDCAVYWVRFDKLLDDLKPKLL